uniref:Uncharacterized protein n=1 Tax=Bionectria ochroleuca TaxID=29856 RepID=A0A0B7K3T9_BIOOC
MSKISPSLKALINASLAHPGPTAAPAAQIREAFVDIARDASRRQLGPRSWIVLSHKKEKLTGRGGKQAAATFTLNSPDSLTILHDVASSPGHHNPNPSDPVQAAELIREVGLKEDVVAEGDEAAEWLAGDEGSEWILRSVDRIVDVLGGGNFAAGRVVKL